MFRPNDYLSEVKAGVSTYGRRFIVVPVCSAISMELIQGRLDPGCNLVTSALDELKNQGRHGVNTFAVSQPV